MSGQSAADAVDAGTGAFASAFDRLTTRWLLWLILGSLSIRGISPGGWIMTPLVLLALRDLRGSVSGVADRRLAAALWTGCAAAVVMYGGALLTDARDSVVREVGIGLCLLGMAFFSSGMQAWAGTREAGSDLVTSWRRSARWSGIVAATLLAGLAIRYVQLAATRQSLNHGAITLETDAWWAWLLLLPTLLVAGVGPLLSVSDSASQTTGRLPFLR